MNRLPRIIFVAGVLLVALPRAARADFFVIPFAGVKFGGSTSIVDLEAAARYPAQLSGHDEWAAGVRRIDGALEAP